MAWKGESRRHSLARKGIKTNIDKERRIDVSNFVARGNDDEHREYIRREVAEFQREFCPYGYLDIEQAILHAEEYGFNARDLQEWLDDFVSETGIDRNDVDITALAYENILQHIRNKIDSEIGFDIMNDADFYTAGNYMATTYDWSSGDQEALIEAIKDADPESRHDLLSDDDIVTWLSEVDIDIKELN